jgi:hypothetical protein
LALVVCFFFFDFFQFFLKTFAFGGYVDFLFVDYMNIEARGGATARELG